MILLLSSILISTLGVAKDLNICEIILILIVATSRILIAAFPLTGFVVYCPVIFQG